MVTILWQLAPAARCGILRRLGKLRALVLVAWCFALLVVSHIALAEQLPDHLVKCAEDYDCALYHDACHSCGDFISIRKDQQETTRAYLLERALALNQGVRSCEWCAIPSYKAPHGCRSGRCVMLGIWAPTPVATNSNLLK